MPVVTCNSMVNRGARDNTNPPPPVPINPAAQPQAHYPRGRTHQTTIEELSC